VKLESYYLLIPKDYYINQDYNFSATDVLDAYNLNLQYLNENNAAYQVTIDTFTTMVEQSING